MSAIPKDHDALLTTERLAAALTEAGYPIAPTTLATRVSRPGPTGSPPFQKWGVTRLYRWGPALQWAQSCLSRPARTSAEHRRLSRPSTI